MHDRTSQTAATQALRCDEFLFQLPHGPSAITANLVGGIGMKLGTAIAEIMKREGIEILCGYPVNHLIEHAANANIRPIIVRQERIGLHMADAISRITSGRKIGAFCMQHGPGTENAYGGIAQAYSESIPLLVVPMGYPRRIAHIDPNYRASRDMRSVAKAAE